MACCLQMDVYPNGEFLLYSKWTRQLKRTDVLPSGTSVTRDRLNRVVLHNPALMRPVVPPHLRVGGAFRFCDATGVVIGERRIAHGYYLVTLLTKPDGSTLRHSFRYFHLLRGSTPLTPLVYQSSLSSPKAKRGSTGLTKRGARVVRNCLHLMERTTPRRDIGFLTLTVPSLQSKEEELRIVSNWGKLVSGFLHWMRKKLLRTHREKIEYVAVTEIQSSRFLRTGVTAPHLHLAFRCRRSSRNPSWWFSPLDIRQAWGRLLSSLLQRPIETAALENLQVVKRSVGRYMSKYLSKGSSVGQADGGTEVVSPPVGIRCWYSVSRPLLALFRRSIHRISVDSFLHPYLERVVSIAASDVSSCLFRYSSYVRFEFGSGAPPSSRRQGRLPGIEIVSGALPAALPFGEEISYLREWFQCFEKIS